MNQEILLIPKGYVSPSVIKIRIEEYHATEFFVWIHSLQYADKLDGHFAAISTLHCVFAQILKTGVHCIVPS